MRRRDRPVTTERFEDYVGSQERLQQERDKALNQARETVNTRLEAMNELRAQINSERGTYVSRIMYDSLVEKVNKFEAAQSSTVKIIASVIGLTGLFIAALELALFFAK